MFVYCDFAAGLAARSALWRSAASAAGE
jgi:hypothetical protein